MPQADRADPNRPPAKADPTRVRVHGSPRLVDRADLPGRLTSPRRNNHAGFQLRSMSVLLTPPEE
ncbi:hypothetical protein GCM10010442_06080 [Kitasatospora kifunensis]